MVHAAYGAVRPVYVTTVLQAVDDQHDYSYPLQAYCFWSTNVRATVAMADVMKAIYPFCVTDLFLFIV